MTLAPRSLLALLVLGPAIRLPTRVSLTFCPLPGMNGCPHQLGYETTERAVTILTPSFIAHRPQVHVPTKNRPITRARAPQITAHLSAYRAVPGLNLPLTYETSTLPVPSRPISEQHVPALIHHSSSSTVHRFVARPLSPPLSFRPLPHAAPCDTPSTTSSVPHGAPERMPSPTQHKPEAWIIPSSPLHRILPPRPLKTAPIASSPPPMSCPLTTRRAQSHRITPSHIESQRVNHSHTESP